MFDRRHLIAEKLAADLSLSALALASSDALLRIIKKSRGKWFQPSYFSALFKYCSVNDNYNYNNLCYNVHLNN